MRTAVAVTAVLLFLAGTSYLTDLGGVPMYIGGDEAQFAAHGQSIAATGRDLNGRVFPLFVEIIDPLRPQIPSTVWYQPCLFYLEALALKFVHPSARGVRLPTALIGLVNAVLIFATAARLFQHRLHGFLAALLLLMSPSHFIFSRQATDYICPLSFALGWLYFVIAFLESGRLWTLAAASLALGIGFYSYIASWILMPLYFLVTCVAVGRSFPRSISRWAVLIAPVVMTAAPGAWWLYRHPVMLGNTLARYHLGGMPASPADALIERISVAWTYFDPSYLFFSGGINPTQTTREAGVFLLAMSGFLVVGLYDLWQRRRSIANAVLLFGFVSAPLAAVVTMPPGAGHAIGRELVVVPFGVLIALYGISRMWRHPKHTVRLVTIALLLLLPVQFAYFLNVYFNEWRIASAARFDPANFRAIADGVVGSDVRHDVPLVYLSDRFDDGAIRWRFYLLQYDREDLWWRTQYLSHPPTSDAPPGTIVVMPADDPQWAATFDHQAYEIVKVVSNPAGEPRAAVLRRLP